MIKSISKLIDINADWNTGTLTDVVAVNDSLELDNWEETFETGNSFVDGGLTVSRETTSAKEGNYGLLTDGGNSYQQKVTSFTVSPNDTENKEISFRTWVRVESGLGLCGICFGVPETIGQNGYQIILDTRDGTTSSAGLQIRKDYDSLSVLAFDEVTINIDTWYKIRVTLDNSGHISTAVDDINGTVIASAMADDTSYSDGRFGICSYSESSFDTVFTRYTYQFSGIRLSETIDLSPIGSVERF